MTLRSIVICALAAIPLAGCYGLYGHDEMELYARRADVVTMSAGDAKEVNARTHMLTPWPVYVGDRRIPMDGAKAVSAMECYRLGSPGKAETTKSKTSFKGDSAETSRETAAKC